MSSTQQMRERDAYMFNGVVREHVYRGPDKSYLSKGEIAEVKPVDHGARPLLGKFSRFNLSYLLPEQRKIFLEQMKFELSLKGADLNRYLSERYTDEDMYQIWKMELKANKDRRRKLGPGIQNSGRKRKITFKQRVPLTPEQKAARLEKFHATLERNKANPQYISYNETSREFRLRQKMLSKRSEQHSKETIAVFASDIINRKVYHKTRKLQLENKQLKEFLRQNGMHLPGSKKDKIRRESLREK